MVLCESLMTGHKTQSRDLLCCYNIQYNEEAIYCMPVGEQNVFSIPVQHDAIYI